MAPILPSGEYYIANAKTLHYLALGGGSEGGSGWAWKSSSNTPELVAVPDAEGRNANWQITVQPNGDYTFQNTATQSFASVAEPNLKAVVGGRKVAGRWALRKGMLPHFYLISAVDASLFWSLGTDQQGTHVTLDKSATNPLNQWLILPTSEPIAETSAPDPHNGLLADPHRGFLPGYFKVKSRETGLYFHMHYNSWHDGTPVIAWRGEPLSRTQLFFIDDSGALCCKEAGISLDIADEGLVGRNRRPITEPYPNPWSHPLPTFSYNAETGCIYVTFNADPAVTNWPQDEKNWKGKTFLLSTLPSRHQRVVVANEYEKWAPASPMAKELSWTNGSFIEPQNAVLIVPLEDGSEKDKRKQWDLEPFVPPEKK